MIEDTLGPGLNPHVCQHRGFGFLVGQFAVEPSTHDPDPFPEIRVYRWERDQIAARLRLKNWTMALLDRGAFPKIESAFDQFWLAYRNSDGGHLWSAPFPALPTTVPVPHPIGSAGAQLFPFGFGGGVFGLRHPTKMTKRINLQTLAILDDTFHDTAAGIAQLTIDVGKVLYRDDLMHREPWGTRPCDAGTLTVCEGRDQVVNGVKKPDGVRCRWRDFPGREVHLWPGTSTTDPQCCELVDGLFAVTTGQPIRLAVIRRADAVPL